MRGNNLNDFKKAFDNNINNTKYKNKTDSGETVCSQHHRTSCLL